MEGNKVQMEAFLDFIIAKMMERDKNTIAPMLKDIPQIYALSVKNICVEISKKVIRVQFPFGKDKLIIEQPS